MDARCVLCLSLLRSCSILGFLFTGALWHVDGQILDYPSLASFSSHGKVGYKPLSIWFFSALAMLLVTGMHLSVKEGVIFVCRFFYSLPFCTEHGK